MAKKLIYQLTYAGIPFVTDQARVIRMGFEKEHIGGDEGHQIAPKKYQPMADLIDELNRLIPFHYLQDFAIAPSYLGKNLGAIAVQGLIGPQPDPSVRINDWYYPVGASRWSVFRGLVTSSMAKAMVAAAGGQEVSGTTRSTPLPLHMQNQPISPATGKPYIVSTNMYMLPPRPLAELGGKFDGFYLITLVDERYWWQYGSVTIHPTTTTQWSDLINQIGNVLNVNISFNVLSAYGQPSSDSQFWCNQESASSLLDAVAYNLGCSVVRGLNGDYKLMPPLTSKGIVDSNRGDASKVVRTAGGDIFSSGTLLPVGNLTNSKNFVLPSSVVVTFPQYIIGNDPVPHFVNQRYQNQRPTTWYEDSYGGTYAVNVPITSGLIYSGNIPVLGGVSGDYSHSIHTTAKAAYLTEIDLSGQPINQSGLTNLAMQIAQDFYNGQVASALDEVYPGTIAWVPEGIHDIIWTYSDRSRQACTRVMKSQWNEIIKEMQHEFPLPYMSGGSGTLNPPGVGGKSVSQTIRDGGVSSGFIVQNYLRNNLNSGDYVAFLFSASEFPTQNRWKGFIDNEVILFEGTSGGNNVGVVFRAIDGTTQQNHPPGAQITVLPNATYGVNLTTYEKMQWAMPSEMTSGGIQGVNIIPQIQTVQCLANDGTISGSMLWIYSGQVVNFSNGVYNSLELVWIAERNNVPITSGKFYNGQFAGWFSYAPIYLMDEIDQHQRSTSSSESDCVDVVTDVVCDDNGLEVFTKSLCGSVVINGIEYPITLVLSDD